MYSLYIPLSPSLSHSRCAFGLTIFMVSCLRCDINCRR